MSKSVNLSITFESFNFVHYAEFLGTRIEYANVYGRIKGNHGI